MNTEHHTYLAIRTSPHPVTGLPPTDLYLSQPVTLLRALAALAICMIDDGCYSRQVNDWAENMTEDAAFPALAPAKPEQVRTYRIERVTTEWLEREYAEAASEWHREPRDGHTE
jgi:hypothetical protein